MPLSLLRYDSPKMRTQMKLVSVNVGLPREVIWRGEAVPTSIFKEPVVGRARVSREGELGAGDTIALTPSSSSAITVADVVSLYAADATNQDLFRRASQLPELPESWRDYFRKRFWEPDA